MKKGEFWAIPKEIAVQNRISLGAKIIYGVLWTMMNGENVAWPSQAKLSEYIVSSVASIKRYLNELEDSGFIIRQQLGLRRSNRYFLTAQSELSGQLNLTLPTGKEQKEKNKGNIDTTYLANEAFAGELNGLMTLFKKINPMYTKLFNNRTERKSLLSLLKRFGVEKTRATIEALPGIINRPYAPKITTPYELEKNLGKLVAFVKQEEEKNKVNIAIIQ